jgi:uncharacterized protein (TIGR02271 family)
MKTVIGLFDSFDDARNVVDELASAGFDRSLIKLENEAKGEFAFEIHDQTDNRTSGALIGGLVNAGLPHDDARIYAEGVNRGGTLVILTVDDDKAVRAYDILGQHGSVDLDDRMKMWSQSGWTGFGETSATMDRSRMTTDKTLERKTATKTSTTEMKGRELHEGEAMLPVVEEELKVGKREILKGGIRAYSHTTERPVQEQVHLREERVHVERHPVDRPLNETDKNAFRDQTIEVRERSEEAVISKRPRVVEEVVIGKEVNDRVETIHDKVRRTDVEVEKLEGGRLTSNVRFEDLDRDFRTHYKGLNLSDSSYDEYLPVYRYGYSLGTDQRYSGGDWTTVEPNARRYWEERNPGTWDRFKDTVRYAWDKVRGHR